jgi:Integrase core domain
VPKHTERRASQPGERLFIDISSIKSTNYGGSKYWLLVVDDYSDFCWSYFLKTKNQRAPTTVGLIRDLKATGKRVKTIRLDNARENKALKTLCIQCSYTAIHQPTVRMAPAKKPP